MPCWAVVFWFLNKMDILGAKDDKGGYDDATESRQSHPNDRMLRNQSTFASLRKLVEKDA